MAKQMMQDIVINKGMNGGGKEMPKEVSPRRSMAPAPKPMTEDPPGGTVSEKKEDSPVGAPTFSPIEASPIFEKMKQHNKDRESFSDEFDADEKNNNRRPFGKIALVLAAIFAGTALFYGFFFNDAILTISLKHADVTIKNQAFLAGGEGGDALAFQLMTLSDESSLNLIATGEKNVTSKSSGKIVIYNTFSAEPQPLIKNTRFQTADGKIYRIRNSIVIPGQKIVGGKPIPGSFETEVYADTAGPEYNIGLVDFTIPGFKGSPRYEKFYARSKTPMTGGASGLVKVVSDADIQKAKETLSVGLKDKLFAEALAQKPKGTILYKDAVFYSFTDTADTAADEKNPNDTSVKFTMKGTVTGVLFHEEDLSKHIVKASDASADVSSNDRIRVTGIEAFEFAPQSAGGVPQKDSDTFAFSLGGAGSAVWQVDTAALAAKLAGIKKSEYTNVFAEFPGIEKANARIRPFWKTKFPSDASKIHIEITQS